MHMTQTKWIPIVEAASCCDHSATKFFLYWNSKPRAKEEQFGSIYISHFKSRLKCNRVENWCSQIFSIQNAWAWATLRKECANVLKTSSKRLPAAFLWNKVPLSIHFGLKLLQIFICPFVHLKNCIHPLHNCELLRVGLPHKIPLRHNEVCVGNMTQSGKVRAVWTLMKAPVAHL